MNRSFWLAANAVLTGGTLLVYAATSAPKVVVVEHPVARPVLVLPAGPAVAALAQPHHRATLADVARDWSIEGRLSCFVEDRPGAAAVWHPLGSELR